MNKALWNRLPGKAPGFGTKAKRFTSKMVFKRNVEVQPVTKDRYGRTITWVYFGGASGMIHTLFRHGNSGTVAIRDNPFIGIPRGSFTMETTKA